SPSEANTEMFSAGTPRSSRTSSMPWRCSIWLRLLLFVLKPPLIRRACTDPCGLGGSGSSDEHARGSSETVAAGCSDGFFWGPRGVAPAQPAIPAATIRSDKMVMTRDMVPLASGDVSPMQAEPSRGGVHARRSRVAVAHPDPDAPLGTFRHIHDRDVLGFELIADRVRCRPVLVDAVLVTLGDPGLDVGA